MTRRSRWMTIATVAAVAAAGAAAWRVRRGRVIAAPTPAAPLSPPVPPDLPATPVPPAQRDQPAPAATSRRNPLIAVAGFTAAAAAIAVAATRIDRPTSAQPEARVVVASSFPAWTPPTTRSWTPATTPPAPVPVGGVLPPNGSVTMHGDSGEEMTLTVVRIANPAPTIDSDNPNGPKISPKLGYRVVSVVVRVENTGGVPFIDDVEKYTWLVDKAGHTYPRNIEMTDSRQLHPAPRLDPGWLNGREIIFEVSGNAEIARFRLSLHPGAAKQTQDWRLT
ncbi:hypothetical protein [Dactylosporangium sp. CA-233914]|uniref:hypothetical protein n=1 Tax=Dactylosporangium sp. CA-233914 TaxID=3239934 RepID=UPI003D8E72A7